MLHERFFVLGIVGAALLSTGACTSTNTAQPAPDSGVVAKPVTSDFELRNGMRRLWQDHVGWTRVYLVSAIAGLPDAPQAAARLLQNQVDIGNAIKPFYGDAAGDRLSSLLHDHITGAVDVVSAAKAGDTAKLATAKTAWYANADAIAAFLASANPNWPAADLTDMMHMHLDLTLTEATARLKGDWAADVAAYESVSMHIDRMADALTAGVAKQFPDKVSTSALGASDQDLHRAMRQLWTDHASWTRFYLMDAIAGLPSTPESTSRLLRNQSDIGDAVKPFYGAAAGDQLTALLREHITGAAAVVSAAKSGDANALASAKADWYANSDRIAAFLAGANPNWSEADLRAHMRAHLDETFTEAAARLHGDWAADVTSYDAVVTHMLGIADVLSDGIAKQFQVL